MKIKEMMMMMMTALVTITTTLFPKFYVRGVSISVTNTGLSTV